MNLANWVQKRDWCGTTAHAAPEWIAYENLETSKRILLQIFD